MTKLAVVGAQGALGYAAVARAALDGSVRAIARRPQPALFDAGVELVRGDVLESEGLKRALEGVSALLFCINAPLKSWATFMPQALDSAIDACRSTGARLVFPGNVWIYGPGRSGELVDETQTPRPTSEKGRLRRDLEERLRNSGVRFAIARLPEFYGPNVANPLMGKPFLDAIRGRSVNWLGGNLDVSVEYVYIADAAHAMVEVARAEDVDGHVFHVTGSGHTTPRAFLAEVLRAAHSTGRVRAVPNWALRAACVFSPKARAFVDILHLWTDPILLDGTKYRQRFQRAAETAYGVGVRQTLAWFREHPDAKNSN